MDTVNEQFYYYSLTVPKMFDLAKAFNATYNPASGLYIRKDRLVSLIPDHEVALKAQVRKLIKTYPAKLTVKILTEGYPSCPCCGRNITKPNMSGAQRDEFIKTCGRTSCQRWYLQQGSDFAKNLQHKAKAGFEESLQPYMRVIEENAFSFIVECTRCGRTRKRTQANATAHCSCSKGASVRDTRALNNAAEKKAKVRNIKATLPKSLRITKVHKKKSVVDIHCSDCGVTQTKPLCLIQGWACGCRKQERMAAHWESVKDDTLKRTRQHLRSLGLRYIGQADTGEYLVRCKCGKEFVPNQPLMLKVGCRSCSTKETASERVKRSRRTCLERYGVEYPAQHGPIMQKMVNSGYRAKPYSLGDRVVNVRGYEPQALDWLLARGINPKHIFAGGVGISAIPYRFQGRTRYYFPDILLKAKGKKPTLIEVKSTWTLKLNLAMNLAKKRAAEKAGYTFHLFVMAQDGTRLDTNKEITKCRKSLKAKALPLNA